MEGISITSGISFRNKENKNTVKIDPCGPPLVILRERDNVLRRKTPKSFAVSFINFCSPSIDKKIA